MGKRLVENILSGINSTMFVYGQTGSGKSHSMFGANPKENLSKEEALEFKKKNAGIIPRVASDLFTLIENMVSLLISFIFLFSTGN